MGVIAEALVALVLADALLEKFGGDSLAEIRRNLDGYLAAARHRWDAVRESAGESPDRFDDFIVLIGLWVQQDHARRWSRRFSGRIGADTDAQVASPQVKFHYEIFATTASSGFATANTLCRRRFWTAARR